LVSEVEMMLPASREMARALNFAPAFGLAPPLKFNRKMRLRADQKRGPKRSLDFRSHLSKYTFNEKKGNTATPAALLVGPLLFQDAKWEALSSGVILKVGRSIRPFPLIVDKRLTPNNRNTEQVPARVLFTPAKLATSME
jgi:hypothetical protein